MKHLILLTTVIATSTCSMIAMDTYREMLGRISNAAAGKPSITLVNNSKTSVWMEIGNLEKDGIRSGMYLHKNTQLTLSPYAHPFFLQEEHSKRGTLLDFYTKRPETIIENGQHKSLLIGGISEIKFGDTVYINCDNNMLNIERPSIGDPNIEHPKRSSKKLKVTRRNTYNK